MMWVLRAGAAQLLGVEVGDEQPCVTVRLHGTELWSAWTRMERITGCFTRRRHSRLPELLRDGPGLTGPASASER